MAELKTRPTAASVDAYLAARASPEQLTDCGQIMALLAHFAAAAPLHLKPADVPASWHASAPV